MKDLIEEEIDNYYRQNTKPFTYDKLIEFYKHSKYLSKPFEILENLFHLFWLDIKENPVIINSLPVESNFNIEGYFKVILFKMVIDSLRANFSYYYIDDNGEYINRNEFGNYGELWDEIKGIFYLPRLILLIFRKEKKLRIIDNKHYSQIFEILKDSNIYPIKQTKEEIKKEELIKEILKTKHELEKENPQINKNRIQKKISERLGYKRVTSFRSELERYGIDYYEFIRK